MASQSDTPEADRASDARRFLERQRDMFRQGFSFSGFERDLVALNLGNGRFLNISGVSGADSVTDGRAAVYADLDNDGDLEIFLRAMHGPAHLLYRNLVGADNHFLRIALQGTDSGRDAFGAVVRVHTAGELLTRVKSGGSGFLSQSDPRLLFGLGALGEAESIEVDWPSGRTQSFAGAEAGRSLLLVEGEERARPVLESRFHLPDPIWSAARDAWRQLKVKPGEALPSMPLASLAGEPADLASLVAPSGFTLVNFWATWCGPCAAEMPELEELHRAGRETRRLQVAGISLDRPSGRERIPAFLQKAGITYPVYTAAADRLGSLFTRPDVSIPLSLLVDDQGRVVDAFSGWSEEARRRVKARLSQASP
ncbi:MAG: ASPIC/UnbV domain-containing protein [Acidobacteriota bacterium]